MWSIRDRKGGSFFGGSRCIIRCYRDTAWCFLINCASSLGNLCIHIRWCIHRNDKDTANKLELASQKDHSHKGICYSVHQNSAFMGKQCIVLLFLCILYTCSHITGTGPQFHYHKIPPHMHNMLLLKALFSLHCRKLNNCSMMNMFCMSDDIWRTLTHCYQSNQFCKRIGCPSSLCNSLLNIMCRLFVTQCMRDNFMRRAHMLHLIGHRKTVKPGMRMWSLPLDSVLQNSLCMKTHLSKSHMSNDISCMWVKCPVHHGSLRYMGTSCFHQDFCWCLADKQCMLSCLCIQSILLSMNRM